MIGTKLAHYEITSHLGSGGMGDVYQATDAKLGRSVAIKLLPEAFTHDGDRAARFEREARLLASLNHSNIAAIHGIEESGGRKFLVMELVPGETLAERIKRGPLPIDEALPIARQIAEALEAAHEKGIIHRDLKPANIKVTPQGQVKVLDFGLAKAFAGESAAVNLSNSPTLSMAATNAGVILGTAAYMSPEQAKGKHMDRTTDIWAFGCVLYEMLAGKRAFAGDDVSDTLASILKSDPDWGALPAETPSTIRRVLRRCLEKDPKRRFHDVADTRLDLDERTAPEAAVPASVGSKLKSRERFAWALIAASLAGVLAYMMLKELPPPQVARFQVSPPENTFFGSAFGSMGGAAAASSGTVSPDGTQLVFAATDPSGKTLLWLRPLDSFTARPLPGTDGAFLPFWSPDSRSIGFFVADKLKTIDAAGGTPQTISDVQGNPRGGTWGTSGLILFSSTGSPDVSRVSAEGGQAIPITTLDEGRQETAHLWPYFLPDGQHFLYWVNAPSEARGIYAGSIEPGASRRLIASDTNAVYAPPGFLLFTREGTLLRQSFDPKRLELTGEATPVAEQISSPADGLGAFSASATGVLTFRSDADVSTQFAWFDRGGRLQETVGPPGNYRMPVLSPDEKRLAYVEVNQSDIWILDLSRQTRSRFTSNPGAASPAWSPDGAKIMYRSTQDGGSVFEKNANVGGTEQVLLKAAINGPSQISPDSLLYFARPPGQLEQDIFVLPLTGERKPYPIMQTPFTEAEPQLSPNRRWLAYFSNERGGRNEVYVQPFPPTGEKWQISDSGGRQPLWRQDGKELFFVSDDRKFYAVDVRTESVFGHDPPRFLFDMRADVFNAGKSYAPSHDGTRFLVNTILDTAASPINVVLNWTAGLEK